LRFVEQRDLALPHDSAHPCYTASVRDHPERAALEESAFVGGLVLVFPLASIVAGRWAGKLHAVSTPRMLLINAAVVVLCGGGWSLRGSESLVLEIARNLVGRCLWGLMAVVGWKVGAWTGAARQPTLRLQRPAG
jgi:hypothetical protein